MPTTFTRSFPAIIAAGIRSIGADYATVHNAASGEIGGSGYGIQCVNAWESVDLVYGVYRGYLSFNTASLGNITILNVYITFARIEDEGEDDSGQSTLYLVEGVHGDSLVGTDFGDLLAKVTSGGVITYANWTASATPILSLNSTGLGWIQKSGITKFGLRLSGDINSQTPTGDNYISADSLSMSNPPILTIVGTSPRITKDVKDIITLEAIHQMEMAGSSRAYIDESGNLVYKSRFARSG